MYKLFGTNRSTFDQFSFYNGINSKRIHRVLFKPKIDSLFKIYLKNKLILKDLFDFNKNNISFLTMLKNYRGLRHKNHYPVRGQRTHTNAKKKIFKFPKI